MSSEDSVQSQTGTSYEYTTVDFPDPLAWMNPSHVAVNIVVGGEKRVAGDHVGVN